MDRKIEVTLAQPHRHMGADYAPGDKIFVTEDEQKFLAERDIIEASSAPAETKEDQPNDQPNETGTTGEQT